MNLLTILLFLLYFFIFWLLLAAMVKRKGIGLNRKQVFFIYLFKVVMGCTYGYIFLHFYGGDDTWLLHRFSLEENDRLFHQTGDFFHDLLPANAFAQVPGFWNGLARYTADLETLFIEKTFAFVNIISNKNYYVNLLFFEFLVSWGPLLLYKLLNNCFPGKKNQFLFLLFFLPTTGFWLSGFRGDGLLFLSIALFLYYSLKWFASRNISTFILAMIGLLGMFIFRAPTLLLFLSAFFGWSVSRSKPVNAFSKFALIYGILILLFFGSLIISPSGSPANSIILRQHEFLALKGNTRFELNQLEPSASSFIQTFPQAFTNVFLRPYFWEAKGILQLMTSAELMVTWILLILFFLKPNSERKKYIRDPLILLFLFFSITQMLFIGYLVPFPGAIVRYKSIAELLFLIPLVISIDWQSVTHTINKRSP